MDRVYLSDIQVDILFAYTISLAFKFITGYIPLTSFVMLLKSSNTQTINTTGS